MRALEGCLLLHTTQSASSSACSLHNHLYELGSYPHRNERRRRNHQQRSRVVHQRCGEALPHDVGPPALLLFPNIEVCAIAHLVQRVSRAQVDWSIAMYRVSVAGVGKRQTFTRSLFVSEAARTNLANVPFIPLLQQPSPRTPLASGRHKRQRGIPGAGDTPLLPRQRAERAGALCTPRRRPSKRAPPPQSARADRRGPQHSRNAAPPRT